MRKFKDLREFVLLDTWWTKQGLNNKTLLGCHVRNDCLIQLDHTLDTKLLWLSNEFSCCSNNGNFKEIEILDIIEIEGILYQVVLVPSNTGKFIADTELKLRINVTEGNIGLSAI